MGWGSSPWDMRIHTGLLSLPRDNGKSENLPGGMSHHWDIQYKVNIAQQVLDCILKTTNVHEFYLSAIISYSIIAKPIV